MPWCVLLWFGIRHLYILYGYLIGIGAIIWFAPCSSVNPGELGWMQHIHSFTRSNNIIAGEGIQRSCLPFLMKYVIIHECHLVVIPCLNVVSFSFCMNPKVESSSTPHVEIFSLSKTLTLSQEHRFVCRKECCCPHTVNISNVYFT